MTLAEAPPTGAEKPQAGVGTNQQSSSRIAWMTSTSSRSLGRLYLLTSFKFLVVGAVCWLILSIERSASGYSVVGYSPLQFVDAAWLFVALFFVLPAWLGLAVCLVPNALEDRRLSFARTAAVSYWLFAAGGTLTLVSFLIEPIGSWFVDDPISGPTQAGIVGVVPMEVGSGMANAATMTMLGGLIVALIGLALGWICVASTVVAQARRTTSFWETPVFAWSSMCVGFVFVLVTGANLLGLALTYFDQYVGGTLYSGAAAEGSFEVWTKLVWLFGLPTLLLSLTLAGGVGSAWAEKASGRTLAFPRLTRVMLGIAALSALSAWTAPVSTIDSIYPLTPTAASAVLGISLGIVALSWLVTVAGKPVVSLASAGIICALLFVAVLLLMAAIAARQEIPGGTTFSEAHLLTIALAIPTMGFIAGLGLWADEIWSGRRAETFVATTFICMFVGLVVIVVANYALGLGDVPLWVVDYSDIAASGSESSISSGAFKAWSMITTAGWAVLLLGGIFGIAGMWLARGERDKVEAGV